MIRIANKYDNDTIKDLLIDFYKTYHHKLAVDTSKWSATHVDKVLAQIYAGLGFVLIDNDGEGFLVAIRTPCLWIPDTYQLQEAMWHGKTKRVQLELLKQYLTIAESLKKQGKVQEYYFNSYGASDFSKYNVKQIGHLWSS